MKEKEEIEWPKVVYRLAAHFDNVPLIKALLVFDFYLSLIGGAAVVVVFVVALFK